MALNIKNPQTVAAIRRLADLTGRNMTEAIDAAVAAALDRHKRSRPMEERLAPILDKLKAAKSRKE